MQSFTNTLPILDQNKEVFQDNDYFEGAIQKVDDWLMENKLSGQRSDDSEVVTEIPAKYLALNRHNRDSDGVHVKEDEAVSATSDMDQVSNVSRKLIFIPAGAPIQTNKKKTKDQEHDIEMFINDENFISASQAASEFNHSFTGSVQIKEMKK